MAATHLLDTSVYSQSLKPQPLPSVTVRWGKLGDSALAISIICEAELLFGLALKGSERLNASYDQLLKNRFPILPVDTEVAQAFALVKANSRKKGLAASDFDFLIAATAKVNGLILATLNIRHFQGIEGLAVENWSN